MASVAEIQRTFLSTPRFAVVGASKDRNKFGNKVLRWYQARELDVTPINPKEDEVEGAKTVHSIDELGTPAETALSVITPPHVTLGVLETAKKLNIPAIWLQPGAENDAVRQFVEKEGLANRVILGGPCILVEGDGIIRSTLKL